MEDITYNSQSLFDLVNLLDKEKSNLVNIAENAIDDLDKIKNFPLDEIDNYINSINLVLNKELISGNKQIAKIYEKLPEQFNKIMSLSQDDLVVLSNCETKKVSSLNTSTSLRKLFIKNCVVTNKHSFTIQASFNKTALLESMKDFKDNFSLNTDGSSSIILKSTPEQPSFEINKSVSSKNINIINEINK